MKSLAIIGSTGSIGKSSLNVYLKNRKNFNLLCLAANSNLKKLIKQKKKYKSKYAFLFNDNIKDKNLINKDLFLDKYKNKKIDYIISGMSGYQAIDINFQLLKICKNLLIANKETIICGGPVFKKSAKKNNCNIIPIDSEHHCIDFFYKNFSNSKEVDKVYLTASGGPFYNKKINFNEKIKNVINHPTWKMGVKISVDSSNFANKVLELFEAMILFNLSYDKIKIKVEQNSLIHAIIKLKNNFLIPIIHLPKMEIPILNSLNLQNNFEFHTKNINFNICKPNLKKFPLINIGYKILKMNSHCAMIFFTVINEKLVNMYLKKAIKYGEITKILIKVFNNKKILKTIQKKIKNLSDIKKAIKFADNLEL